MQQNGRRMKVNVTPMSSSISAAPSLLSHTISHKMPKQQQQQQLGPAMRLHFMPSLQYRSCPLQLSVFIMGNGGITQSATAAEQTAHLGHSNSARTPLLLHLVNVELLALVFRQFLRGIDATWPSTPCLAVSAISASKSMSNASSLEAAAGTLDHFLTTCSAFCSVHSVMQRSRNF